MTCNSGPSVGTAPRHGAALRDDIAALPGHTSSDPITLAAVAANLGLPTPDAGDTVIAGVSDDSRTVRPGELYLAFPGRHAHGLDFEDEARGRGAVALLSDRPGSLLPTIVVDEPRAHAGAVSAFVHRFPSASLDVYGVTGTNGKTSTTYFLDAALKAAGETVGTITGISIAGPQRSVPASKTTPEAATLQSSLARFLEEGATAAALEVSSHAVVERRVDGTRFAVMGFTNLGRDHLDYHGSMEGYFAAKAQLFDRDRAGAAAIGIDDAYGRRLAASVSVPCVTWSVTDPRADVYADAIECTSFGSTFGVRTPSGAFDVRLRLLGPHQVHNAVAAVAMVAANDGDVDAAVAGIAELDAVPGRLERIDVGQPYLALVDYMHNTAGQRRLLPYLRSLTTGKLIVVVGATGDRDPGKRFPLGATAAALADVVIVTDESPGSEDAATIRTAVAEGAVAAKSATVVVEPDRRRALTRAVEIARAGDVLVVAGRGCDEVLIHSWGTVGFDDRAELRQAIEEDVRR